MKQYKSSDKTMLKMTREGAVEVNAATGKKKRISKRIRDADFAKTEAPVYSTIKLPKKSVRIPHFQKGKFPIKSGTH